MARLRKYVMCTVLLLMLGPVFGQNITPVGISNYGTAQSMFISPSLNNFSAYNWHVNLAGVWVNANNNFLSLQVPYSLYKVPNRIPQAYRTENGNAAWDRNWLVENLNGRRKHVSLSGMVYGPSASVKIKNFRVGVFTQGYGGVRIAGMSENIAHAIYHDLDSARGAYDLFFKVSDPRTNTLKPMTLAANSSAAVGFNVSTSIPMDWDRQMIFGLSIKRAFGFQGGYFHSNPIDLRTNLRDSLFIQPTSFTIMEYGSNERGKGWGYDIGATYIYHKKAYQRSGEYNKNITQYHSKISFALMDIGSVNYSNAWTGNFTTTRDWGVNLDSFGTLDIDQNNYQNTIDSLVREYGTASQTNGPLSIGLPTRFVVSVDRQLRKRLFVSATWTQSLRGRYSRHMRLQSTVMLAPRLEYRYFEVSTPLLLAYDYRSIRLGTNFRIGPLYIGSNNILPFVYTRGFRDVDFFVGIAFGNIPGKGIRKWLDERHERRKNRKKSQNCVEF